MSNSDLNFFNRSGNSPTPRRKSNKTKRKSASERGKEYRNKKGAEGREQDRFRKQVDRADAKTPEGMKILKEIVGNENVEENMRIAAAEKILATPELSTTRGSWFNNAPSGCGKLVYTGNADHIGDRFTDQERQLMGADPVAEASDPGIDTDNSSENENEPPIEIVEETLELTDDDDDNSEAEEVLFGDGDEDGDICCIPARRQMGGRRVAAQGATPSDGSMDSEWVSFRDTEKWRHDERQKQHVETQIIDTLVRMHFKSVEVDGDDYSKCDLCKELIWWPRDCEAHILRVHGSRNLPSHDRRFGNIVAQYKKQLKARP